MSTNIPPAPIRDPWGSYTWEDWFRRLRDKAVESLTSVLWSGIDFTSSKLSDIIDRKHNYLTSIQGGTSGEYYHLTSGQYSALGAEHTVTTVSVDTTMGDTYRTYLVDTSGKVITLPAANTSRVGYNWTVTLNTTGYVTIKRQGSDTLLLPTNDTSIILNTKGSSVTFRCITATSWGIV